MSASWIVRAALFPAMFSLIVSCMQQERSPNSVDTGEPGAARVIIRTGKVGALAKATAINLANLDVSLWYAEDGEILSQPFPISGNGSSTVSHTFTGLVPLRTWYASVRSVDVNGRTIHTGSATFRVEPGRTAEVNLNLNALYSMLRASFHPIRDSVNRVELWVDGILLDDSAFAEQSAVGDTIPLTFDYLSTGTRHDIRLDARGNMWGRDTLLYSGDTTLEVLSGQDAAHRMLLRWVGPGAPPAGQAAMMVSLGRLGNVSIGGELEDTTRPVFPFDSGLVAYYPFNGTASDASGQGNHGSVSGARFVSGGAFSSALEFDGVDDHVEVADAPSLDLTGNFTLSAWIRPTLDENPFERQIICKTMANNRWPLYSMGTKYWGGSSRVAFVADGNANFQAPYPASSGIWTHVAATYDGDFRRIFVNGQMVAIYEQHGPIPASTNNLYIGSHDPAHYGSEWRFLGAIDEVRIHNRALPAAEIEGLFRLVP